MTISTLDTLHKKMQDCVACGLCNTRTNVVFGAGNKNPQILLIGEAPGEEEDIRGVPFIGKAGQKLDKILEYVGVKREDVYIANSVLCRPPNNRNPLNEELAACKWRLDLQIQLLKPKLIILLGRIAVHQFMGTPIKGTLSQYFPENIEGGWIRYKNGDCEANVLVTYHPSFHLRSPDKAYKTSLPHWTKVKEWLQDQKT